MLTFIKNLFNGKKKKDDQVILDEFHYAKPNKKDKRTSSIDTVNLTASRQSSELKKHQAKSRTQRETDMVTPLIMSASSTSSTSSSSDSCSSGGGSFGGGGGGDCGGI